MLGFVGGGEGAEAAGVLGVDDMGGGWEEGIGAVIQLEAWRSESSLNLPQKSKPR